MVSELRQLHKVELAQLENHVDGQVLAGKYEPLKSSGFRRARDMLVDNPIVRAAGGSRSSAGSLKSPPMHQSRGRR